MSSSMAQACSASDEPHCANRVYCFAFARRNAQRCNTKKKRTSRNSARLNESKKPPTCSKFQIVCSVSPSQISQTVWPRTALNTLTLTQRQSVACLEALGAVRDSPTGCSLAPCRVFTHSKVCPKPHKCVWGSQGLHQDGKLDAMLELTPS
jgi:hypothetical protein